MEEAVNEPTGQLTAADVLAAFADGLSPDSAAVLLRARDDGLPWEQIVQAVGAGLAICHNAAQPKPHEVKRQRSLTIVTLVGGVVAYVLLRPLLGLGHELAVAALAWLLHLAVGTGVWEPVIHVLGLDPIYSGAAIRAAGGVQVAGFAVAGPLGAALHGALPGICLAQGHLANGAGISMVAAPGAPAIGRGLAAFGADVLWLAIGLWLFWRWRNVNWRVALVGLFVQAQIGVNHLLDAQVGLADINASGLPFAIALAMPDGGWFTSGLAALPSELRNMVVGGSLLALGYTSAVLIVVSGAGVVSAVRLRRGIHTTILAPRARTRWSTSLVGLGLALVTAWSPIGALALGQSNWQAATATAGLTVSPKHTVSRKHTLRLAGATPVAIAPGPGGGWTYLVDGTAETIRGVGYNPEYAALSAADRSALYQRDFADMQRLGINTIEGWFEGQFDSVTLDNAARNGIGVLMPFELNQDWDYTDPAVRAGILDRVSAYVERYKNHPAVRMWAPGNENLHRILYTRWVSQANVPAARARADAFAAFLPVLVDRIHELDPNHPVVYRDAEDVYLSWITKAFAKSGVDGVDRPWLVYGANVYSAARLQEIVSKWPAQWPGRPLLISEFAPGGVGPAERPVGFQQQWNVIRSHADVVLGGLAYTWATNGPEDLDRVFGLVDPQGVPTDGALAALSGAYLTEAGTVAAAPNGR